MTRPRSTRDLDSAPGDEPGAEAFARGGSEPGGIVRLSDLVGPSYRPATEPTPGASDLADALPDAPAPDNGSRGRRGPRRRAGRRDAASDSNDRRHSSDAAAAAAYPEASSSASGEAPDTGPAYESLFGGESDTRRKPRRERKPATAMQRALGLLTRREHSRKELTRKLVSRGVDAAEVEAAVGRLTEAGWQDDRRFAESLVRSRASGGYGPIHIRAELGTHDLPVELRQAALDDFEGDWVEIARDLVGRRFSRVADPRQRARKAADYLIRRGFPGDVVRAATRFTGED